MLINSTDHTFHEDVLNSDMPVLVDFWAKWCNPCKMLAPVIEQVSHNLEGQVKIVKLDVDENTEFPKKFGIMSIPTMILFKDGKAVGKIVGFKPVEQIESAIRNALNI